MRESNNLQSKTLGPFCITHRCDAFSQHEEELRQVMRKYNITAL